MPSIVISLTWHLEASSSGPNSRGASWEEVSERLVVSDRRPRFDLEWELEDELRLPFRRQRPWEPPPWCRWREPRPPLEPVELFEDPWAAEEEDEEPFWWRRLERETIWVQMSFKRQLQFSILKFPFETSLFCGKYEAIFKILSYVTNRRSRLWCSQNDEPLEALNQNRGG